VPHYLSYYVIVNCAIPSGGLSTASLNARLPKLTVMLDGVTLTLNAIDSYLQAVTDTDGTQYYCTGILSAAEEGQTILGYSIMNQYTVVFDRANSRIGWAPSLHCGGSAPVDGYSWYVSGWHACEGSAGACSQNRTGKMNASAQLHSLNTSNLQTLVV
jgi:hypothetical protein